MGEVYRARDTKLKRDVAIKILPEEFSRDADRVIRFQREAEVLASLNHPHIAAIYDLQETNGSRYLVLELVEGETLADRIARGPIPAAEALDIAKNICEALEAAHEKGIIHRDLKPANVKITPEGKVKVLDFGLAKAMSGTSAAATLSNSPTLLSGSMGQIIVGTAAYMSPEQARGREADQRSDVFAFGCVLYEMMTGRQAFQGEDVSDVLAAVLRTEPDFSLLPTKLNPKVCQVLRRCLEKNPKLRWHAIADVRLDLLDNLKSTTEVPLQAESLLRRRFPWAVAAVLAVIAGLALWEWLKPATLPAQPVMRFAMTLPANPNPGWIGLSRDGSRLAFGGGNAGKPIYVRTLDQFQWRPLVGTEDAVYPVFSPDGQWIAYMAGFTGTRQLKKISIAGGSALTLADHLGDGPGTIAWEQDDYIYFGGRQGLERVPSGGGKPEILATVDSKKGELAYNAPQVLPGGKLLLFSISLSLNNVQIAALNLQTAEKKILLDAAGWGSYAPTGPEIGHIVYARNGSLFAAAFDPSRLRVGSPVPVVEGIAGNGVFLAVGFSNSGTLAYVPGSTPIGFFELASLVWVDRQGREEPLSASPQLYTGDPRLSPEGRQVAISVVEPRQLVPDVWVYDLTRGTLTRVTSEKANLNPVWTPDGKRLLYASSSSIGSQMNSELRAIPADSSGPAMTLLTNDGSGQAPSSVSPDGKLMLGLRNRTGSILELNGREIFFLPLAGGASSSAKPEVFLASQFIKAEATFSPNGRWVAFQSNDTGRDEVYVMPYPGPGGKSQVSTDGGTSPRWSHSGRELFYRNGDKMMAVDVETATTFRAGTPKMLFQKAGAYDVSADGKRFLLVTPVARSQSQTNEMDVVVNWFRELQQRVPMK
jgi:serine/threonine-protein kinase